VHARLLPLSVVAVYGGGEEEKGEGKGVENEGGGRKGDWLMVCLLHCQLDSCHSIC
jgi:hypothetical protein